MSKGKGLKMIMFGDFSEMSMVTVCRPVFFVSCVCLPACIMMRLVLSFPQCGVSVPSQVQLTFAALSPGMELDEFFSRNLKALGSRGLEGTQESLQINGLPCRVCTLLKMCNVCMCEASRAAYLSVP